MPAIPNTVPTVITDKNGKRTTVHKKRKNGPGKASKLPILRLCTSSPSPEVMVDEIIDIFTSITPLKDMPAVSLDRARLGELDDLAEDNHELLAKIHAFVRRVNAHDGAYSVFFHLLYSGVTFKSENMSRICDYTDIVVEYPDMPLDIIKLHSNLSANHKVQPDSDGRLPTMAAHMKALVHYGKRFGYAGKHPIIRDDRSYEVNVEYIRTVEKHADHIDALIKYRDDRNVRIENGKDINFDVADFDEYLKNYTPLSEGWL